MSADKNELRILILEDVPSDAELAENELLDARQEFTSLRVDTRNAFEQALDEFKPDIVLADYNLPSYNGREALEYTRRTHPHIPVILVTGALGDEAAVELLKLGARDYVLKGNLVRLVPAIRRALSEEEGIRNRKIAEGKYKALFSEAMDGILLIDCETWRIEDCNPEFERQTGRTLAQLKELKVWEVLPPEQHEQGRHNLLEIQQVGSGRGTDFKIQKTGGEIVPFEFSAKYVNIGQQSFIQCITRDISERLLAETRLRASDEKHRLLFESSRDALMTLAPPSWKFSSANAATLQLFGASSVDEFTALGPWDVSPLLQPDGRPSAEKAQEMIATAMREGSNFFEWEHQRIGGLPFAADVLLTRMKVGEEVFLQATVRDISERKASEAALKLFRALIDQSNDAIVVNAPVTFQIIDVNETACRSLGYSRDELLSMRIQDIDPDMSETQLKMIGEELPAHGSIILETRHRRKDGSRFPVEVGITAVKIDKGYGVSVVRDITERKRSEDALRRANRALRTLSAGNMALVRSTSEDELLHAATNVIVEQGGYSMAMVCYAEDDPENSIKPMAWSGTEAGYLWEGQPSWADTEQGQLPVSRAIRIGTTQIRRDIAIESGFKPWREAALARGYVSNIALPLSDGNKTFGGLSIYSSEVDAFDEEEVRLLQELANDLAYGIIALRTRVANEQYAKILRQSLEQSIQTIANTLEARDPYTAGHQRRVGDLATAIAREMGLPEDRVDGIHFAAVIHDLGKIHVPAEILAKPGKLTDIEFLLVKVHPQAGYDILENVQFPWPIADIVLQHHEKLDGSGYPQGLRGEQIMLEARIVAVADVMEAMSSHRPYRPGLGIEAALEEIERHRGVQYDAQAVDACTRLFRERGYKLPA